MTTGQLRSRRGDIPRWVAAITLAGVGWLIPSGAVAQSECAEQLRQARADLQVGRFERVVAPEALAACTAGKTSRAERASAHKLIARAYLALDDLDGARGAIDRLLAVEPDHRAETVDGPLFARVLRERRELAAAAQVGSVSKTAESLREAPATVAVVTAEEIARRGYLDLEAVLHDLPGFDLSRANGPIYSAIYQRGYRSDLTDRTLFLVDGIEQNDLFRRTAIVSRQYPLSNVDRIEIVYGPASTMYGANAYTGVINVITKEPQDFLEPGSNVAAEVHAAAGSFDTSLAELNLAGRAAGGDLSWSLSGRGFRSDEQDLSRFPEWDWDLSLAGVDYDHTQTVEGATARALFDRLTTLLDRFPELIPRAQALLEIEEEDGVVTAIRPTAAGREEMLRLDRELFAGLAEAGELPGFADHARDWSIFGKLRISNLTLGLHLLEVDEGADPFRTDAFAGEEEVGGRELALYARYSRPIVSSLSLSYFGRYKEHEIHSLTPFLLTYAAGIGFYPDLVDLVSANRPFASTAVLRENSTQLRNELTLVWDPGEKLTLVAGVDLKASSIQDRTSNPESLAHDIETRDFGVFAHLAYEPVPRVKLVAGGRLDSNEALSEPVEVPLLGAETLTFKPRGYGSVFNPRLAVVCTPRDLVFKLIYAEAFQEASNFQKYDLSSRLTVEEAQRLAQPNAGLDPEKVENVELSAGWHPSPDLGLEVAAYESTYSNVIVFQRFPPSGDREFAFSNYVNGGALRIRGIQASLDLRRGPFDVHANYTYTDPRDLDPQNSVGVPVEDAAGHPIASRRVGDIASHRLNAVANAALSDRLDVNLRVNYVGERETGSETSVFRNPLDRIDAYWLAHATAEWRFHPAATLQVGVNNLFDSFYEDPGLLTADGSSFAARLPQPGRTFFARLRVRWPGRGGKVRE